MATLTTTQPLPRRKRRKMDQAEAKTEMKRLLAQRRFAGHRVIRKTIDIIKILVIVALGGVVGKYAVTGFYDTVLETHQPLVRYTIECLALATAIVLYGHHRARRGKPTSWGTVYFLAGLVATLGIYALDIHLLRPELATSTYPLETNTDLWHWTVRNATVRNIFMRDWPEGLFGGLFGVFYGWNTLKRRSKHHFMTRLFKGWLCNLEEEDRSVTSWMVWLTPVLIVVFGLPFAILAWHGTLFGTDIHAWVHHLVPWHANLPLNNQQSNLLAKAQDSVTASLPMFIIGFASARWFGRVPAFGVIDEYQEYLALRRVAKFGKRGLNGHIFRRGILRWYQSTGYQLALIQEYNFGQHNGDPVAYADARLATYDHGLVVPLRLAQTLIWVLVPVGMYFLMVVAK